MTNPVSPPGGTYVLGIDPGLASCGLGVVYREKTNSKLRLCEVTTVKTPSSQDKHSRFLYLARELDRLLDQWPVSHCAMETLYFAKNVSSAFPVAEVRGMIHYKIAMRHLAISEFTPMEIKQNLVGYGKASKEQVILLVGAELGITKGKFDNHGADALAVAICAMRNMASPVEFARRTL